VDDTVSKPPKTRSRDQLSRAEIKAYEARRAAARQPVAIPATAVPSAKKAQPPRRTNTLSRAEEFNIIKADMKRLVVILMVLLVVLIMATIILR
jgi:hypothetical protein